MECLSRKNRYLWYYTFYEQLKFHVKLSHRSLKFCLYLTSIIVYSLKTQSSQCHYVMMRFSVLVLRSDVRIELQAPVVEYEKSFCLNLRDQVGLILTCTPTPKDRFSHDKAHLWTIYKLLEEMNSATKQHLKPRPGLLINFACWVIVHAFVVFCCSFSKLIVKKLFQEQFQCQTVQIQIRNHVSVLI